MTTEATPKPTRPAAIVHTDLDAALKKGKRVEIKGWGKSDEACRVIAESMTRYDAAYGARKVMPV